ncbi:MAG TPA: histidine phosphatase family protein [Terriglobales bacterium]|jgi:broad specificity phosphatase PhoE|nr:histidine phosphatase family protein [Terriglobales bacterium]
MGTIYLVRHGQASFGADHYDQLSPVGVEQSRLLGSWICHCNLGVDRVVIGTNRRHRQTAELSLAGLREAPAEAEWQVATGFTEFDYVEVLGRACPDLRDEAAINAWLAGTGHPRREFQKVFAPAFARWVSGAHDDYTESYADFRRRCWQGLSSLSSDAENSSTTWVFTSGGPISAIVQEALGIANERIADLTFSLVNTGVTKLLCRPGRVRATTINQYAHLEQAGRPDWITYR